MEGISLDAIKRQIALEEESLGWGKANYEERIKKAIAQKTYSEIPPSIRAMQESMESLSHAIKVFRMGKNVGGRLAHIKQLIEPLTDDEVAYITLKVILNEVPNPQAIQRVSIQVGTSIQDLIEYKRFREAMPNYVDKIEEHLKTHHAGHRRRVLLMHKRKKGIDDLGWDQTVKCNLGLRLIELVIEATGIVQKSNYYVSGDKQPRVCLEFTPEAEQFFKTTNEKLSLMSPVFQPMVIPPRDWESVYEGGFYRESASSKYKLIRTRNRQILKDQGGMPDVYATINNLQRTAWRINRRVLEVMKELWESKNTLGVLPPPDDRELPPTPWISDEEFNELKETRPEVVRQWKIEAAKVYEQNARDKSKRYATNFQIFLANKFANEERIYFVWYMDWRGRFYPIQNFLHPQGSDTSRGLLEFATGKRLGEEGIYWLAVHGANCYGIDKVSLDERVQWVKDHEREILACAENPFENRFWTETNDKPWMFLAFCFEWAGVKELGSDFVSHLPVNMDGSCNGLQHFSALLRDEIGGAATNLVPQDRPNDIYTQIKEGVIALVEADLENSEVFAGEFTYADMARAWQGKIDRSIVKRNVMTTPYGVTKRGLLDQIKTELNKRDADLRQRCDDECYLSISNFLAARYLSEKTEQVINNTVVAAKKAMDWLKGVAKVFNEAGLPVVWQSPSGFTIRQEVFKKKSIRLNTLFGKVRLQLNLSQDTTRINGSSQINGIAPNFIHSMDASHMVATVNRCATEGIQDFSMIHDSFGCHAADVPKLNQIIRHTFVQMYSEPQLKLFLKQVLRQLPEKYHKKVPPIPEMGNLELESIKESRYFFA